MWSKLNNTNYYISFSKQTSYEMFITDFINIWSLNYSKEDFMDCVKNSNIDLEACDLVQKVEDMLNNLSDIKNATVSVVINELHVNIMTKKYGYPVNLKIKLHKGSEKLFFEKVTQPLMNVIKDLSSSQEELFELLKKKDREIEDYRLEGAKLYFPFLKTQVFDVEEHIQKHNTLTYVFPSKEIPNIQLPHSTTENDATNNPVKQEVKSEVTMEADIKQEPESTSVETMVKREDVRTEPRVLRKKRRNLLNL